VEFLIHTSNSTPQQNYTQPIISIYHLQQGQVSLSKSSKENMLLTQIEIGDFFVLDNELDR
jgi:hypothetical protein